MPVNRKIRHLAIFLGVLLQCCAVLRGQTGITLTPAASPTAGQPGVTVIAVLGTGFPAGTIPPADVTVNLQPAHSGSGPSAAAVATAVTTVIGTTRRVSFVIPTTISVAAPTAYLVTISGTTSTSTTFASVNSATLTIDPGASIISVVPNTGQPGQTVTVALTGVYTNFLTGSTQANFGAGISVGGKAEGSFGPVTASSATVATASLTVDAAATLGPRTIQVQTGVQTASLVAGFSVTAASTLPPPVANPGGPYTGVIGQAVSFNGSGSSNPAGNPLSYEWFFGDGGTDNRGPTPKHTYTSTGPYTVTLLVSDSQRETACASVDALNQCLKLDTGSANTSATINLTSDTTPPTVTITSPTPLLLLNQRSTKVAGTVSDPHYTNVPVVVNGITATVSNGAFQASTVPLKEGDNILTAVATDGAGNVGSASLTVVVDTTAPNIQINMPANNAVVSSSTIDVAGIVNDAVSGTVNAAQVTVTVNGTPAIVSNRSFLAAGLPLTSGVNIIKATATDKAGNQTQTQVQVTRQASFQPQIVALSGDNQSGPIGSTLPNPLAVQLLDATGKPIAVRPVTFTVVKSDGVLLGFGKTGQKVIVNTNANGQASIPFQLGSRVGEGINQIVATYAGTTAQAIFLETSTVSAPAQIHLVSGSNQIGVIGEALPLPLIAIVTDSGDNPIAGASVTFTVDLGGGTIGGSSIATETTDTDGKVRAVLVLGQQEGINNNSVSANYAANTGLPVIFTASGEVAGNPATTVVSGVVLDNANNPVPNATATIVGTNLSAVSNNIGAFTITSAPVGAITLLVDGRTSTRPETFPFLSFNLNTIAGQNNTIGMPVLLPPLDMTDSQIVGGAQDVVLSMAGIPGFQVKIFANSVTFPDGTHVGRMSMSQVHLDKVPMQPPNGTAPLIVGTLQPPGVLFNPPVQVQAPNVNGSPPGMVLDVYSFDHDLEQFISQGPARVSSDGTTVVSDPGFGIVKSGWFVNDPPNDPTSCVDPPPPCMKVVNCKVVPDPDQDNKACKGPFPKGVLGTDSLVGDCSTGSCTALFNDTRWASAGTGEDKMYFAIDKSCFGTCQKGVCQPSQPDQGTAFNVAGIESALDTALSYLFNPGQGCIGGGLRNTMQLNATSSSGGNVPGLQIFCTTGVPAGLSDQTGAYIDTGGRVLTLRSPIFDTFWAGSAIGPNAQALLHEFVHGFANDPGAEGHNTFGLPGNPPDLAAPAAALALFATDRPYGCEASCGGLGGGNKSACQ